MGVDQPTNDTIITDVKLSDSDLYIVIFGSKSTYDFTWTASFQTSSTLIVDMKIYTDITGSGEKVYVEFPNTNNIKSIYSLRQTNPDLSLSGLLNAEQGSISAESIGQTTLYIYLFSVGISVVSSFGGNSMELMWMFTNTLQLIYYTVVILY